MIITWSEEMLKHILEGDRIAWNFRAQIYWISLRSLEMGYA